MVDLYTQTDYREYLSVLLDSYGQRSGKRKLLAEAIGSSLSHVSQVLSSKTHLTLEQAESAARFLNLEGDELLYFLFLAHRDRAGTVHLRQFY